MKKTKNLIGIWLILIVLLVVALPARAAETVEQGTCGAGLTWAIDSEGVLTVTGSGAMEDYEGIDTPWISHRDSITAVVIGEGVTSVGAHAFSVCRNLTEVRISGTVTSIGAQAFAWAENLEAVTFDNCDLSLGDFVFWDCPKLHTLILGSGVETFCGNFFEGLTALRTIQVHEDNPYLTAVDGVLFSEDRTVLICCPRQTESSYMIPEGVSVIGDNAFRECDTLTTVTIPASVTSIGTFAFGYADNLSRVILNSGEFTLGDFAFWGCDSLTTLELGLGLSHITADRLSELPHVEMIEVTAGHAVYSAAEGVLFSADGSTLVFCPRSRTGSYAVPEGTAVIGEHAFLGCSLTQVRIPSSVTAIEDDAFAWSGQLARVELDCDDIDVGDFIFWECPNLKTVYLSPEVTALTDGFLSQFEVIEAIEVDAGNTAYTSVDGVLFSADGTVLVRYPRGRAGSYTTPSGVTTIGFKAFESCSLLTELTVSPGVTAIEDYAMHNCGSLTTVTLPEGLIRIGFHGFSHSPVLARINFPESVTEFDGTIFEDCTALREQIEAPETILMDQLRATDIEIPGLFMRYFHFTPDQTGWYTFLSQGDEDVVGQIWDEDGNLLAEDDDGGPRINFAAACRLEAGKVYTLGAKLYSDRERGEFAVKVEKSHHYEPVTETAPGCTADGVVRYTCGDCGVFYTETIPAGHSYTDGACTRCGQEEQYESSAVQAQSGSGGTEITISANIDRNTYYSLDAEPIYSVLAQEADGYMRAECIDGTIVAERYDRNFVLTAAWNIPLELPRFGGICMYDDYNFVVCGQYNPELDDTLEVVRIICYTKEWERLGCASLYAADTQEPFAFATLRFARSEDLLYIHTGRVMYNGHQANTTLCADISRMAAGEEQIAPVWLDLGYVSHALSQLLLTDGQRILTVDLGDGNPREVIMHHWREGADKARRPNYSALSQVQILYIAENLGAYQHTGVALGAAAYSDTHYLVAGNTCAQTGGIEQSEAQRNIFVTVTPKDDPTTEATGITYFTDYGENDDVLISAPHLVKIDDNRFCLIWAAEGMVHYCMLDGQGRQTSEIFSAEGHLSDCVPIVTECAIVWYVTDNDVPVFWQIDLGHRYENTQTVAPTCTEPGYTVFVCTVCGQEHRGDETAAAGHTPVTDPAYAATCMETGLTEGSHCGVCGFVIQAQEIIPSGGHIWGPWSVVTPATCLEPGEQERSCSACGTLETEQIPVLDCLPGDVNGDGSVNADDAIYLLYHTLFGGLYPVVQECDFDGSGSVDADDAIYLLYYTLFGEAMYPLNT